MCNFNAMWCRKRRWNCCCYHHRCWHANRMREQTFTRFNQTRENNIKDNIMKTLKVIENPISSAMLVKKARVDEPEDDTASSRSFVIKSHKYVECPKTIDSDKESYLDDGKEETKCETIELKEITTAKPFLFDTVESVEFRPAKNSDDKEVEDQSKVLVETMLPKPKDTEANPQLLAPVVPKSNQKEVKPPYRKPAGAMLPKLKRKEFKFEYKKPAESTLPRRSKEKGANPQSKNLTESSLPKKSKNKEAKPQYKRLSESMLSNRLRDKRTSLPANNSEVKKNLPGYNIIQPRNACQCTRTLSSNNPTNLNGMGNKGNGSFSRNYPLNMSRNGNKSVPNDNLGNMNVRNNNQMGSMNRRISSGPPANTTKPIRVNYPKWPYKTRENNKQINNKPTNNINKQTVPVLEKPEEHIKLKSKKRVKSKALVKKTVPNPQPGEMQDIWFECNLPIRLSIPNTFCLPSPWEFLQSMMGKSAPICNQNNINPFPSNNMELSRNCMPSCACPACPAKTIAITVRPRGFAGRAPIPTVGKIPSCEYSPTPQSNSAGDSTFLPRNCAYCPQSNRRTFNMPENRSNSPEKHPVKCAGRNQLPIVIAAVFNNRQAHKYNQCSVNNNSSRKDAQQRYTPVNTSRAKSNICKHCIAMSLQSQVPKCNCREQLINTDPCRPADPNNSSADTLSKIVSSNESSSNQPPINAEKRTTINNLPIASAKLRKSTSTDERLNYQGTQYLNLKDSLQFNNRRVIAGRSLSNITVQSQIIKRYADKSTYVKAVYKKCGSPLLKQQSLRNLPRSQTRPTCEMPNPPNVTMICNNGLDLHIQEPQNKNPLTMNRSCCYPNNDNQNPKMDKPKMRPSDLKICLWNLDNNRSSPTLEQYNITAITHNLSMNSLQKGKLTKQKFQQLENLRSVNEENVNDILAELQNFCQIQTPRDTPRAPVILIPFRCDNAYNGKMTICEPDEWQELQLSQHDIPIMCPGPRANQENRVNYSCRLQSRSVNPNLPSSNIQSQLTQQVPMLNQEIPITCPRLKNNEENRLDNCYRPQNRSVNPELPCSATQSQGQRSQTEIPYICPGCKDSLAKGIYSSYMPQNRSFNPTLRSSNIEAKLCDCSEHASSILSIARVNTRNKSNEQNRQGAETICECMSTLSSKSRSWESLSSGCGVYENRSDSIVSNCYQNYLKLNKSNQIGPGESCQMGCPSKCRVSRKASNDSEFLVLMNPRQLRSTSRDNNKPANGTTLREKTKRKIAPQKKIQKKGVNNNTNANQARKPPIKNCICPNCPYIDQKSYAKPTKTEPQKQRQGQPLRPPRGQQSVQRQRPAQRNPQEPSQGNPQRPPKKDRPWPLQRPSQTNPQGQPQVQECFQGCPQRCSPGPLQWTPKGPPEWAPQRPPQSPPARLPQGNPQPRIQYAKIQENSSSYEAIPQETSFCDCCAASQPSLEQSQKQQQWQGDEIAREVQPYQNISNYVVPPDYCQQSYASLTEPTMRMPMPQPMCQPQHQFQSQPQTLNAQTYGTPCCCSLASSGNTGTISAEFYQRTLTKYGIKPMPDDGVLKCLQYEQSDHQSLQQLPPDYSKRNP